jgi:hypothetical protein
MLSVLGVNKRCYLADWLGLMPNKNIPAFQPKSRTIRRLGPHKDDLSVFHP